MEPTILLQLKNSPAAREEGEDHALSALAASEEKVNPGKIVALFCLHRRPLPNNLKARHTLHVRRINPSECAIISFPFPERCTWTKLKL